MTRDWRKNNNNSPFATPDQPSGDYFEALGKIEDEWVQQIKDACDEEKSRLDKHEWPALTVDDIRNAPEGDHANGNYGLQISLECPKCDCSLKWDASRQYWKYGKEKNSRDGGIPESCADKIMDDTLE